MKYLIMAFAMASSLAQAETIRLRPGESISNGYTTVTCGSPRRQKADCQLLGPGKYGAFTYKFRVAIDGEVVAGEDFLSQAIDSVRSYQNSGLCDSQASARCKLLGPGQVGAFSYKNRIAVGNNVVMGEDFQSSALDTIRQLKDAGVCR
jgi:hypothetical protein